MAAKYLTKYRPAFLEAATNGGGSDSAAGTPSTAIAT